MKTKSYFVIVMTLFTCGTVAIAAQRVSVKYDHGLPQASFAASAIRSSLTRWKHSIVTNNPEIIISLDIAHAGLPPQGYSVRLTGNQVTVLGGDANGLMYGGLELAERIDLEGDLSKLGNAEGKPYVEKRGIKFNVPLDLRTPSYSDCSDAFQQNIPEMWKLEFWHEFLDEMARQRFNVLSLWSLHPFPSLVRVPEFPEVALADVWRTRVKLDDSFSHSGDDMLRPALLENVEVVKRMSIDEKIRFWREVMQYAHDRGIEVYLFTWNIFTFGAEPKYGITSSPTNATTIAYFRASVRETVLTYPLLAGIGITAGEHMPKGDYSKEGWLWETYGEGIRDAKKLQPNRHIRLIHRFHMTGQRDILQVWKDYPDTFDFSFKYAIAHMYSVTNPPFIKPLLADLAPDRRTWLTVRNDDIYSFRWGDPEFARGFVRGMPGSDRVAGFYMGPDGYCWGRSFLDRGAENPPQLVMSKQWYSFMLWGRLSYDPAIPDSHFQRVLARRFAEVPASDLSAAWAEASKVFPQITRFFWGDIDLRWFPEACLSSPKHKGFFTVRHFMEGETMPESGILNIRQWREQALKREPFKATTPLNVAEALERHAANTLRFIAQCHERAIANQELRLTIGDLEAFAHLGNYYAAKIRGACELAMFDATQQPGLKTSAVKGLQDAVTHWKQYARVYARQYQQPLLYNRVGWVNIPALVAQAEQDVSIAQNWQPGSLKTEAPPQGADRPFRK